MRVEILQPFTCSRDGGSVDLKAGQEAFISGDNLLRALEAGGYIRVLQDAAKPCEDIADGPVKTPIPKTDDIQDEPAKEDAPNEINASSENLTVRHIGRGRFAVYNGNERVSEPMTKESAEAALAGMQ